MSSAYITIGDLRRLGIDVTSLPERELAEVVADHLAMAERERLRGECARLAAEMLAKRWREAGGG